MNTKKKSAVWEPIGRILVTIGVSKDQFHKEAVKDMTGISQPQADGKEAGYKITTERREDSSPLERTCPLWRAAHVPFTGSHYLAPGFPRRKIDSGYPNLSDFLLEILNGSTIQKHNFKWWLKKNQPW